jgi:AraC-like DNA-binding protein/CheY-like chemotaxis protein
MLPNMQDERSARFALITAGHHFLMKVLPFRKPESYHALESFITAARRLDLSAVDHDAVLLRCLTVLDSRAMVIPRLIDRYLATAFTPVDCLSRFSECVKDCLRYHCITNGSVQEALSLLATRYADPQCTPQLVAENLGMRLPTLDVLFKQQTGGTITEHLRHLRLERAAILLATTNMSVKEVWAEVGYNHHSNFDHDFKRRFQCAPREYRSRAHRPVARTLIGSDADDRDDATHPDRSDPGRSENDKESVLIVDDDDLTRATLSTYLRSEGYAVTTAARGADALPEFSRLAPDVILLDYRLAGEAIDGVDILRSVREHPDGDRPAIAIITADWDIGRRADEINELNAIAMSKLCDLDQIGNLVAYLAAGGDSALQQVSVPWWRQLAQSE